MAKFHRAAYKHKKYTYTVHNKIMITRKRLPVKLPYHKYNLLTGILVISAEQKTVTATFSA